MNALVIGASGKIGQAICEQLVATGEYSAVIAIARQEVSEPLEGVTYIQTPWQNEQDIVETITELSLLAPFSLVVIATGMLHEDSEILNVRPEKRLEDISAEQIQRYFHVNSVLPLLWLKSLLPLVKQTETSHVICLSARVGSIGDNRSGGWYGYRASKAALNMLVKTASVEYQRRAANVCLSCYHPGTVDSPLSLPFQRNVPPEKLFTAQFTAKKLLHHIKSLSPENGPYFIDWQGKSIQW